VFADRGVNSVILRIVSGEAGYCFSRVVRVYKGVSVCTSVQKLKATNQTFI